jgi:hypothetical protein
MEYEKAETGGRGGDGRKEFYCRKRCLGEKFLKQKVKLIRKQKALELLLVA